MTAGKPHPGARVSGIVLAGGSSVRFGSDKLAAIVGGRPLVHRPIEALASICDEVVVCVGPGVVPSLLGSLQVPLRIVGDDEPGAGPLAGLITGLQEAVGPSVIVVGGDMPSLVPELLRDLVRRACAPNVEAAALMDGTRLRPLPMALRRDVAIGRAASVRVAGGSSLRALLEALMVDVVSEADWRLLDPSGASLLDVDEPADLALVSDTPGDIT